MVKLYRKVRKCLLSMSTEWLTLGAREGTRRGFKVGSGSGGLRGAGWGRVNECLLCGKSLAVCLFCALFYMHISFHNKIGLKEGVNETCHSAKERPTPGVIPAREGSSCGSGELSAVFSLRTYLSSGFFHKLVLAPLSFGSTFLALACTGDAEPSPSGALPGGQACLYLTLW